MMDLDEVVDSVVAVRSTSLKPESASKILVCGIIVQVCDSYLICLGAPTVNAGKGTSSQIHCCLVGQLRLNCFPGCRLSKVDA